MKIHPAFRFTTLLLAACPLATPQKFDCPFTTAPSEPFIPPSPWQSPRLDSGRFLFGTPGLWAIVTSRWSFKGFDQSKLFFLSELYDWKARGASDPPLAVVARRLDAPAPLVWSSWVRGTSPAFTPPEQLDRSRRDGGMVTSLDIPAKGCWEISAHFTPARDHVETLTYVVLVE